MFGNTAEKRIAREADKATSLKEDLDAFSWGRVMDIGRQLQAGQDARAVAAFGAELTAIAQTNISLALRLGIDSEQLENRMLASGMEVIEGGLAEAAITTKQETDADVCCVTANEVAARGQAVEEELFEPQEPSDALLFSSTNESPVAPVYPSSAENSAPQVAFDEEPETETPEQPDAVVQPTCQRKVDDEPDEDGQSAVISSKGSRDDSFARFRNLYESRDGSLCVFEDDQGHLVAVDSSKLA